MTARLPDPLERHVRYMNHAIGLCRAHPTRPFAAILVDRGRDQIVAEGHNRTDINPILHAEIDAINQFAIRTNGRSWTDLSLYSTAEPCPMCQAAIAFAGIGAVYFGVAIPWLAARGWRQIDISALSVVARAPWCRTEITGGVREDACRALFLAARPRSDT